MCVSARVCVAVCMALTSVTGAEIPSIHHHTDNAEKTVSARSPSSHLVVITLRFNPKFQSAIF